MLVTCISKSGESLSDQSIRVGYQKEANFSISMGKEYDVFAMGLWCGVILLLVADEQHLPSWFPIELFVFENSAVPANWSFLPSLANEQGLQALWGYEQLITDASHYDGLLERNPTALRYFYDQELLRSRCE